MGRTPKGDRPEFLKEKLETLPRALSPPPARVSPPHPPQHTPNPLTTRGNAWNLGSPAPSRSDPLVCFPSLRGVSFTAPSPPPRCRSPPLTIHRAQSVCCAAHGGRPGSPGLLNRSPMSGRLSWGSQRSPPSGVPQPRAPELRAGWERWPASPEHSRKNCVSPTESSTAKVLPRAPHPLALRPGHRGRLAAQSHVLPSEPASGGGGFCIL